jgi:acyl-CoA thioesterase-1
MMLRWNRLIAGIFLAGLTITGCSTGESTQTESAPPPSVAAERTPDRPKIVALGDSLTAGYGISKDTAYPALLQKRLEAEGFDYEVVNAGVSGDTSAGGLSRLDWALDGDVKVLIVALGGNDGLRGLPVSGLKKNLATIIERAQERGAAVILAGMEAPPNQGDDFTSAFRNTFKELAEEYEVVFFPFLLEDVAGRAELNLPDGIHPNPDGARIIAENIWGYLEPLLLELQNP